MDIVLENKVDGISKLKSFFILICFTYEKRNAQYPEFRIQKEIVGYYSSVEKAQKDIGEYEIKYFSLYGFVLEEKPLDEPGFTETLSVRTYGKDKRLFSVYEKDSGREGSTEQTGLPYAGSRFKYGDIVEVFNEDRSGGEFMVHLGIVSAVPETSENSENPQGYYEVAGINDISDPMRYSYLTGSEMFAPQLHIPKYLKEALKLELKSIKKRKLPDK